MALQRVEIESFYRRYGALVFRRARVLLGSDALAQDAVQEVFMRALQSGDGFRRESSPVTWLYSIATHYCLNELRNNRTREARLGEAPIRESPTTSADSLLLLRQVLSASDQREATAAIHVYVDQMSYDEVAERMSVSRRTVANLIERFVRRARGLIDAAPSAAQGGGR